MKTIILSFLLACSLGHAASSTCAQDLVDAGWVAEYGNYNNPLNYALWLCGEFTTSNLEEGISLIQNKYVTNKVNYNSLLGYAAHLASYYSASRLACAKVLFDNNVAEGNYGNYNNMLTYMAEECTHDEKYLNCAADLVWNGYIPEKKNYYSRFSLARYTCENNPSLVQREHSTSVQNFFALRGKKVKSGMVPTEPVTLPDQLNVVLKNEVFIAGDERCGAAKSGVRGIQCWVCQEKSKNNDRLLNNQNPIDPEKPRIMVIQGYQLTKPTEMTLKVTDDPSITEIRCMSNKKIFLYNRKDIFEILEANDLKIAPSAPVKE